MVVPVGVACEEEKGKDKECGDPGGAPANFVTVGESEDQEDESEREDCGADPVDCAGFAGGGGRRRSRDDGVACGRGDTGSDTEDPVCPLPG